jgi:hypothetical protein
MFRLDLRARLDDDRRITIVSIEGTHDPIVSDFAPTINPMLLMSIGRTGTTWAMRLLSHHPSIVANTEYPYETRAAQYWMHALRIMSEPMNLVQSATSTFFTDPFKIGHPPFANPASPVFTWTNGPENVSLLAGNCQSMVEAFYNRVAAMHGKRQPVYFIEKVVPTNLTYRLFYELYAARTILMVRDPRDMISSILAFNRKRGTVEFGRRGVDSDETYVAVVKHQMDMLAAAWTGTPGGVLLRYEDLITRPAHTLSALLEQCGLDYSPDLIRRMLDLALADDEGMKFHRTSSSAEESIGRWKRDLSPSVKASCDDLLGDVLQQFGYTG